MKNRLIDSIDSSVSLVYIVYIQGGGAMKVKFREVGNSLTITIPKDIVNALGLKKGTEAEINMENDKILVVPQTVDSNVTLKSLFKDYKGDYKPNEIDWGDRKGNEVW